MTRRVINTFVGALGVAVALLMGVSAPTASAAEQEASPAYLTRIYMQLPGAGEDEAVVVAVFGIRASDPSAVDEFLDPEDLRATAEGTAADAGVPSSAVRVVDQTSQEDGYTIRPVIFSPLTLAQLEGLVANDSSLVEQLSITRTGAGYELDGLLGGVPGSDTGEHRVELLAEVVDGWVDASNGGVLDDGVVQWLGEPEPDDFRATILYDRPPSDEPSEDDGVAVADADQSPADDRTDAASEDEPADAEPADEPVGDGAEDEPVEDEAEDEPVEDQPDDQALAAAQGGQGGADGIPVWLVAALVLAVIVIAVLAVLLLKGRDGGGGPPPGQGGWPPQGPGAGPPGWQQPQQGGPQGPGWSGGGWAPGAPQPQGPPPGPQTGAPPPGWPPAGG